MGESMLVSPTAPVGRCFRVRDAHSGGAGSPRPHTHRTTGEPLGWNKGCLGVQRASVLITLDHSHYWVRSQANWDTRSVPSQTWL